MSISQHSLRACTLKYSDRDVCRSSEILQFYFRGESEGGAWGLKKAERISAVGLKRKTSVFVERAHCWPNSL